MGQVACNYVKPFSKIILQRYLQIRISLRHEKRYFVFVGKGIRKIARDKVKNLCLAVVSYVMSKKVFQSSPQTRVSVS